MNKRLASFWKTYQSQPSIVRIGQATLGVAVIFLLYNLITALLDPVWQQWVFAAVSFAFLLTTATGVTWLRSGRMRLGGWLLIGSMQVLAAAIVLLYTNIAFLTAMIAAAYTLTLAPLTLNKREINVAIIAGLSVSSLVYIADFFITFPRTQPLSPIVAWILGMFILVLYGAILIRQFPTLNLRTRYLLSTVLGTVIVVLALVTYFINTNTQNITDNVQRRILAAAEQTAADIDNFIVSTLNLARTAAHLPTIRDFIQPEGDKNIELSDIETLLESLRNTNPGFIFSYTLVDTHGRVLATAPAGLERSAYIETLDISYALRSQLEESFVSPIETVPNGRNTLAFVVSVKGENNEPIGAIIVRYNVELLQNMVGNRNGAGGADSFGILIDNNQIILAHGKSPQSRLQTLAGAIGLPASSLRDLTFHTFIELPLHLNAAENEFIAIANLQHRPWQVLFAQPKDTFLAPVRAQARAAGIISFFSLLGTSIGALLLINYLARPLVELTRVAEQVSAGNLNLRAQVQGQDEVGTLARTFNQTTSRLQELLSGLEAQVAKRTQQLEERTTLLRASSEVAGAVSNILNVDALITQVVNTIQNRFRLYYVGLFLVAPDEQWAILRAGTGLAGEKMLARGHRIQIGSGMVGWSILHGQPRIAQIAESDAVRVTAPELPDTRSEAALPLRSRGRTLGALTVQSTVPNAFDEDTLSILQTMADQIAVALDNARLFDENQRALQATQRAFGKFTHQAWLDMISARPHWGYRYAGGNLSSLSDEWSPSMQRAVTEKRAVTARDAHGAVLALPLLVRDTPIGALQFQKPADALDWSASEIKALENLSTQIATALDNARLYEETQRNAFQEKLRAELVSRVRQQNTLERVIATAAEEIYTALHLEDVVIRLSTSTTNGNSAHE
ncbi:MAG: hypothetical protein Fur0018_12580 [Anaerolineales bacterium]